MNNTILISNYIPFVKELKKEKVRRYLNRSIAGLDRALANGGLNKKQREIAEVTIARLHSALLDDIFVEIIAEECRVSHVRVSTKYYKRQRPTKRQINFNIANNIGEVLTKYGLESHTELQAYC